MTAPAIRLKSLKLLKLNFPCKWFITPVSVNHHPQAPIKNPAIRKTGCQVTVTFLIIPVLANKPRYANNVNGLVMVRR